MGLFIRQLSLAALRSDILSILRAEKKESLGENPKERIEKIALRLARTA